MDMTKPEKTDAARTPTGMRLTPPLMTKADWQKRTATSVTLSRSDLEQLAQLIGVGRQVLRDGRPIAANLKAAMSRLGVSTHGL
jgi:hypothetical protein